MPRRSVAVQAPPRWPPRSRSEAHRPAGCRHAPAGGQSLGDLLAHRLGVTGSKSPAGERRAVVRSCRAPQPQPADEAEHAGETSSTGTNARRMHHPPGAGRGQALPLNTTLILAQLRHGGRSPNPVTDASDRALLRRWRASERAPARERPQTRLRGRGTQLRLRGRGTPFRPSTIHRDPRGYCRTPLPQKGAGQ